MRSEWIRNTGTLPLLPLETQIGFQLVGDETVYYDTVGSLNWSPTMPGGGTDEGSIERYFVVTVPALDARGLLTAGGSVGAQPAGDRADQGKPRLDLIPADLLAYFMSMPGQQTDPIPWARFFNLIEGFQMNRPDAASCLDASLALLRGSRSLTEWTAGIAAALEYGEKKYAAWNWTKGLSMGRILGPALRHAVACVDEGDDAVDAESGLSHRYLCAVNLCFARWMVANRPSFDDRPVLAEYVPTI